MTLDEDNELARNGDTASDRRTDEAEPLLPRHESGYGSTKQPRVLMRKKRTSKDHVALVAKLQHPSNYD